MNCTNCNTEFTLTERDSYLPDFFILEDASLCLQCIIKSLASKQTELYPQLNMAIRVQNKLKTAYFLSSTKVSKLNKEYMKYDYDRNLILHNINKAKQAKQAKANQKSKQSKESTNKITEATVQAMLANLTEDQRNKIMANYKEL